MANQPGQSTGTKHRSDKRQLLGFLLRPGIGATLFSFGIHLVLITVLSLLVIASDPTSFVAGFSAKLADSPQTLTDVPVFEIDSPAVSSLEVQLPTAQSEVLDIRPVLKFEPKTEVIAVGAENVSSTTKAVTLGENSLIAGIQKRVEAAGGKSGEIQFALAWKDINDLDLHVITPSGERISHTYRRSRCRGELDVDMNVEGESTEPVENVRWLHNAPSGRYSVLVNLFRIHEPHKGRVKRLSEFQLLSRLGNDTQIKRANLSPSNQVAIFRFIYVAEEVEPSKRQTLLAELTERQQAEEVQASEILAEAKEVETTKMSDLLLHKLIARFPHSDAAVEAMKILGGNIKKVAKPL